MQLRDHDAVASKRDYFTVDPRVLKTDSDYNVRDLVAPDTLAHIAELKGSIAANGVRVPLEVRLDGEDIYIVAGHCRHQAVMELISEGVEIKTVPAIPEPKHTSEIDRTLNLAISNSGLRLKPMELARVVKRLLDFGWDEAEIAKRIGWKSRATVTQHLELIAMPAAVQDAVRHDDISATEARKLARDNKADPEFASKLIADMKAENAKWPKGGKIKPRQVKAKLAKEKPKTKQDEVKYDEQALAVVATTAAPLQDASQGGGEPMGSPQECDRDSGPVAPARTMTEQELIEGLAARGYHVIKDDGPEAIALPSALAATQNQIHRVNGVKHLIAALEPFAALAEFNDLNAKSDDDVIEVKVIDIKRAWRAYTDATGAA